LIDNIHRVSKKNTKPGIIHHIIQSFGLSLENAYLCKLLFFLQRRKSHEAAGQEIFHPPWMFLVRAVSFARSGS